MAEISTKQSIIIKLNNIFELLVNSLFPHRILLITMANIATVIISFLLAFYVRFIEEYNDNYIVVLKAALLVVIIVKPTVFMSFRLYNVMWRYVSISDILKIFYANLTASILCGLIIIPLRTIQFPGFSIGVLVIDLFLCFLLMSGKKLILRVIREEALKATGDQSIRTVLVGNAASIYSLLQAFSSAPSKRKVIGVICDDMNVRQMIRGVPVLGQLHSIAKCAKKHYVSEILLLPPYSTPNTIQTILDDLETRNYHCELRMVPSYTDIADGNINVSHIREVEIEDLLGRLPVKLDRTDVAEFVKGKNVMVTGAGGSIGSELCRQLASYQPSKMVFFEFSEYNIYQINNQIRNQYPDLPLVNFVGDVRSKENVARAIKENHIDIVYHAAAFKHVPLMEENPQMAFRTNVLGSANVAACCEQFGVKRFVMISTDKAVRPTSVMGATKRMAERVLLEREKGKTEFVVVRFGNVLGSSGSVIPLFKKQIKAGGPVTVTSENVIRYFMSIPEAVDLVLQAGAIGNDRDIMVLEMGKPVRIYDMAIKLIELSGFTPHKDIEIKVTGLRPGEKEYEELLTEEEKVTRTPYDRIYVARKEATDLPAVELESIMNNTENNDVAKLKQLICRYIPENMMKFDN